MELCNDQPVLRSGFASRRDDLACRANLVPRHLSERTLRRWGWRSLECHGPISARRAANITIRRRSLKRRALALRVRPS